MTVRISELNELSSDLAQGDLLPIVDLSGGETKKIQAGNFIAFGISGAPSSFIDLAKLNQSSATKLAATALATTGVGSGTYGSASTVPQFTVNSKGLVTFASGVPIVIAASGVTGLAPVATSGTYASLTGLPTLGSIASQSAGNVAISGGTISGVTLNANSVTISGGTIFAITELAIADGGTGASTASGARANLGLAIGTNVQAYSSVLSGVAGQFTAADQLIYASASGVVGSALFTSFARSIVSGSTGSGVRSTLGLGSIAVQDAGNVAISGGTISGITDLAVADGGTGASTAANARTNLGLAIGTNVQAYSPVLSGIAAQFTAADEIIYASASGVVASAPFTSFARSIVSGSTASGVRSTLGLGSLSVQNASNVSISGGTISGITLTANNALLTGGTISGATIVASGVSISGGTIVGIADIAIADGGTGASTASGARTNLGLAIGTNVQAYSSVLSGVAGQFTAADQIIYASASGVVASAPFTALGRSIVSGSTASGVRSTLGLGSMAVQNAGNVTISGGTISGITDLTVADGGTGASTASGARSNLGLIIGTDVQAYDAGLASIAGLTTSVDQFLYTTAADTYAAGNIASFARTFLASGTTAAASRSYLGVGAVGALEVVTSGFIATGAVLSGAVADGAITSVKIASGNVITSSIADSAVTTAKINNDAITAAKIADNSTTIIGTGAPLSTGGFIGQQYIDSVTDYAYAWDGSAWQRLAAISAISFSDSTPLAFSVAYPDQFSATITSSLENQAANAIFAGPASGSAAVPSFRALTASDLPIATASTRGAVLPGAGLSVTGAGALDHSNSAVAGTYAGPVTIDAQGHIVSALASLQASDIPNLDASKITTGSFNSAFLAPNSVTAQQLADYGIAQVSETAPTPEFAGQWWINPASRSAYIWVGEVAPTVNGYWLNLGYGSPTQINLRFGGTYNASGNVVASINSYGIEAGLTVGQGLASPNTNNNGVYLIVTTAGSGATPAPSGSLSVGNWVLSEGIGSTWTRVNLGIVGGTVNDEDVLVAGASLVPAASGIASQQGFNDIVWARVQIAASGVAGITRPSSEVLVASGTGIMTIGEIDEGTY